MNLPEIREKYSWALNDLKISRAVDVLTKEIRDGRRKEYTEEEVKALYIAYGGALLEETAADIEQRAKYFPIAKKAAAQLSATVEKVKAKTKSKEKKVEAE